MLRPNSEPLVSTLTNALAIRVRVERSVRTVPAATRVSVQAAVPEIRIATVVQRTILWILHVEMIIRVRLARHVYRTRIWEQVCVSVVKASSATRQLRSVATSTSALKMDRERVVEMPCAKTCLAATSAIALPVSTAIRSWVAMSAIAWSANASHHINLLAASAFWPDATTEESVRRVPSVSLSPVVLATVHVPKDIVRKLTVPAQTLMSARRDGRSAVMAQSATTHLVAMIASAQKDTVEMRTMDCVLQLSADAVVIESAEQTKSVYSLENVSVRHHFSSMPVMEISAKVSLRLFSKSSCF